MIWRCCAVAVLAVGGGFLTATIGFGGAIFTMMFFPYMFPFIQASAISSAIVYVGILVLTWQYRAYIQWKSILLPVACYVTCGVWVVYMLPEFDVQGLKLCFGVFILLLAIYYMIFSNRIHLKGSLLAAVICSSLSGIGTGLFGIGGPPVALYILSVSEDDKNVYLGTLQAFFSISMLFTNGARVTSGILTTALIPCILAGLVGTLVGKWCGTKVAAHMNIELIKKCVCVFMVLSGVTTIADCLLT